jgi:hypothetical protein
MEIKIYSVEEHEVNIFHKEHKVDAWHGYVIVLMGDWLFESKEYLFIDPSDIDKLNNGFKGKVNVEWKKSIEDCTMFDDYLEVNHLFKKIKDNPDRFIIATKYTTRSIGM